jgi:glycosyltransferase involved in cell wall biosynthesis
MLNKYKLFAIKKGLKLIFTQPKSLYYKYKYYRMQNQNYPSLNQKIISQVEAISVNFNTICIFNSVQTGGTYSYIQDFIKQILSNNQAVLLVESKNFTANCNVSLLYNDNELKFATNNIFTIIEYLPIKSLILNHLIFNPDLFLAANKLSALKIKLNLKLSIIMHDYFYLCPSFNLLNFNNTYCGLPTELKECNNCLQGFKSNSISYDYIKLYAIKDIKVWREQFRELLYYADDILVPSEYVGGLISKIYPDIEKNIQVIKHDLKYIKGISFKLTYLPFAKPQITIMTMGNITPHKGSNIIYSVLEMLNNSADLSIRWVILGDIMPYYKTKNLILHLNYNIVDLPALINKYQPDLFVLPSIWPETYCYTATEMMHFNLPVVAFNLGAHASRIKDYQFGFLVDEVTPVAMFNQVSKIISSSYIF